MKNKEIVLKIIRNMIMWTDVFEGISLEKESFKGHTEAIHNGIDYLMKLDIKDETLRKEINNLILDIKDLSLLFEMKRAFMRVITSIEREYEYKHERYYEEERYYKYSRFIEDLIKKLPEKANITISPIPPFGVGLASGSNGIHFTIPPTFSSLAKSNDYNYFNFICCIINEIEKIRSSIFGRNTDYILLYQYIEKLER